MSLKHLTSAEMVSLSSPWTQPDHADRAALGRIATVAALLPALDQACAELIASLDGNDDLGALLDTINAAIRSADNRHNAYVRAIDAILSAHIHVLSLDPAKADTAQALRALHGRLFPVGLRIIQARFFEKAGQGALSATRLTAKDHELLGTIPVAGGSLADWVRDFLAITGELRELLNQRAARSTARPRRSAAGVVRARNRWIRVVKAMIELIEIAGTSDPTILDILTRIRVLQERAASRRRRSTEQDPADTTKDHDAGQDGDHDARQDGGQDQDPSRVTSPPEFRNTPAELPGSPPSWKM